MMFILAAAVMALACAGEPPEDSPLVPTQADMAASLSPALQQTINTIRPTPQFDAWATPLIVKEDAPPPKAVVYRWWTVGCPFCKRSLPAFEQLRKDYASRGIQFVAVFHPKGLTRLTPQEAAMKAKALGFHGAVALDLDWSELRRLAGPTGLLSATSVTLVLDGQRNMVHAHKGPGFCQSDSPRLKKENAGYVSLRAAIERIALPTKVTPPPSE
jgi:thiol-disulfide isomerase/thioredoxin